MADNSSPQSTFGADALNWRFTRSSGQGAAEFWIVVFTVLPRTAPRSSILRIRRATVQRARRRSPLAASVPDLSHAVDAEVLRVNPPDLGTEPIIPPGTGDRLVGS